MFERSVERVSGLVFLLFLPPSSSQGGHPGQRGDLGPGTEIRGGDQDLGLIAPRGFDLFEMYIFVYRWNIIVFDQSPSFVVDCIVVLK